MKRPRGPAGGRWSLLVEWREAVQRLQWCGIIGVVVHHSPAGSASAWNLVALRQAWDANLRWDGAGVRAGGVWTFRLPEAPDPRRLAFTFHPVPGFTNQDTLVADVFTRCLTSPSSVEVWTFEASARVLDVDPRSMPPLRPGDFLTVRAVTRTRYRGGRPYAWTPYDVRVSAAFFAETARDDKTGVSTFKVPLLAWMTRGFNFKLVAHDPDETTAWEPESANRVWRPCDGISVWIRSGRCDLSADWLAAEPASLEIMYAASWRRLRF